MTTLAELRKRAEAMRCPYDRRDTFNPMCTGNSNCTHSGCPRAALLEAVAAVETRDSDLVEQCAVINLIVCAVENRCMAVDGPVTPTLKEMREGELRHLWLSTQRIIALLTDAKEDEGWPKKT